MGTARGRSRRHVTAPYDPRAPRGGGFLAARDDFLAGRDTPRDYLERHLAVIAARENEVRAFTVLDTEGASAAADAAAARYRQGSPLSPVDGLPVALKDIFEVAGLPTTWGIPKKAQVAWRDAAIVHALRKGGAVILGKTTLPELGFGQPAATTNPWDAARSPGGSSSGSAAEVGAGMVPVAIGTQGKGSLTRPASFCGCSAFKPGHGTIHRGGDGGGQETNTHVGVLAHRPGDAWAVARYLSDVAGPHPGHRGMDGPAEPPPALMPKMLVRLTATGWDRTDGATRAAFDALIDGLARAGVTVAGADELPGTRALARDLDAAALALDVIADYESRWPLIMYLEQEKAAPTGAYSERVVARGLERGAATRAEYHEALAFRDAFRAMLDSCRADWLFLFTPSATGPAPMGTGDTGSSVYQWGSSLAGNPVVSLPLMAVDGMPLGLEMQGFARGEADLMAAALALDEGFADGRF
ncbi:MAG: amidase [Alphaproteobacteria bacterium]|nr:amidase [Alphaproteobacteria bacterium]